MFALVGSSVSMPIDSIRNALGPRQGSIDDVCTFWWLDAMENKPKCGIYQSHPSQIGLRRVGCTRSAEEFECRIVCTETLRQEYHLAETAGAMSRTSHRQYRRVEEWRRCQRSRISRVITRGQFEELGCLRTHLRIRAGRA